jgi:cytochrome c oxidase subunit 2
MKLTFNLTKFLKTSALWAMMAAATLFSPVKAELKIQKSITGSPVSEEKVKAGMELFKGKCSACHTLDAKLIGPALGDVSKRRTHQWLLKWVKNNKKFRENEKDADAIKIFEEYNGSVMTAFEDLSDDQINTIIMYTENGDPTAKKAETTGAVKETDPSLFKKINWILMLMFIVFGLILIMVFKILDLVGKLTGREVIKWNRVNANLMLIFLIVGMTAAFWEYFIHEKYFLPSSASEHGLSLDGMMSITFIITGIVFVITQILLFWFAFRYQEKKNVKALFYPDNHKLEFIWTLIPAVVLTVLVVGGLLTWQKITAVPDKGLQQVEIFAYQFGWNARYPGADNKLGNANYNLISGTNPLGLAVKEEASALIDELNVEIKKVEENKALLHRTLSELKTTLGGLVGEDRKTHLAKISEIESGRMASDLNIDIRRKKTQITRIEAAIKAGTVFNGASSDDVITDEIHLPVNKSVTLRLRARDVIHSAYLPYFRTQMNVVPGLPTQITLKPITTTREMRKKLNNPEFEYYIICNKICGNAHFNMKMKVVVESPADYKIWLNSKTAAFAPKPANTQVALK